MPPAQDSPGLEWHRVPAYQPVDSPKKAGVSLAVEIVKGSANVSYKQEKT